VAALVETVKRRASVGTPAYLTFVDLPKAYGAVPREALFGKTHQLGVREAEDAGVCQGLARFSYGTSAGGRMHL